MLTRVTYFTSFCMMFLVSCTTKRYHEKLVLCEDIEKVTGVTQDVSAYQFDDSTFVFDANDLRRRFFSAWREDVQHNWITAVRNKYYVEYFNIKKYSHMYSCNLQRWSSEKLKCVRDNMCIGSIGKISRMGIVVRNTICKCIPVDSPLFANIYAPGGSYPFDENVQSVLRIGLPLFVSHLSCSKEWAFVYSETCSGWVKFADIAYVDEQFAKHYTSLNLGVFIEDGVPIRSKTQFHETSNIGMLLPIVGQRVLIPVKTSRNKAFLRWSQNKFKTTELVRFPYIFSQNNVHSLINKLLGKQYYWGGNIYGGRDCSLTIKDFMCVFGKYIPRNSKGQIDWQDDVIDLTNACNKEKMINELCVPFQSIVYLPGHVMLYVGHDKDKRAVFFHNVAGICRFGEVGRFFVGSAILSHGDDTKNLFPREKTLIQKVVKISRVKKI